ncbi:MAG: orotate phosphoribosyltransferase [Candidatus Ranarchaeia archaeon]
MKTRLVHALDIVKKPSTSGSYEETKKKALDIVSAIKDNTAAIKINYPLTLATDLRFISKIKELSSIPIIADFKVADIENTSRLIANQAFASGVDAIITHAFVGEGPLKEIVEIAKKYDKGVIAVTNMSHPSSKQFISPNTRALTDMCVNIGVSGIIAPGTRSEEISKVRDWIPNDVLILAPGIGAQGGLPGDAIRAGANFEIVGRTIYNAENPKEAAEKIGRETHTAYQEYIEKNKTKKISTLIKYRPLIINLVENDIIRFGDFTLASGKKSPYYIDLRLLPSHPLIFKEAMFEYKKIIENENIDYDVIAGVPTAGISFASVLSQLGNKPLIYLRKQMKKHGTKKQIEGDFKKGQRVLLVDDLITAGGSLIEAIKILRDAGAIIEDVIVLIDREQGGINNLRNENVNCHTVIKIRDIVKLLDESKLISKSMTKLISNYLNE